MAPSIGTCVGLGTISDLLKSNTCESPSPESNSRAWRLRSGKVRSVYKRMAELGHQTYSSVLV